MQNRWVRRFGTVNEGAAQVICLPHAGGSAGAYRWLAGALAPEIEVLCLQYPGRQDRLRERPLEDVGELATEVVRALAGSWTPRTVVFGHSMGAVVAFEAVRLVEQIHGRTVAGLIVSAREAPSLRQNRDIHRAGDDTLVAELAELGGTEAGVLADEELRPIVLPAVRADYRAVENYWCAADALVSCPIVAYRGDDDPRLRPDNVLRWEFHTTATVRHRRFPGGHFYLQEQPEDVAATLAEDVRSLSATAASRE